MFWETRFGSLAVVTLLLSAACGSSETKSQPVSDGAVSNVGGKPGQDAAAANPEMGPKDNVAALGCTALVGSAAVPLIKVNASPTQADAEVLEAKIAVDGSKAFEVTLPEGKEGWVALDQDTWDATVAFFVTAGAGYEIKNAQMTPKSEAPLINAACPDSNLTDYRVFFTHWTPASLRFSAAGPRQVKLLAVKVP